MAVSLLRSKADASYELLKFVRQFEQQTGHLVRVLHTDGGREFLRATGDLKDKGVHVHKTTPYIAESTGLAERSHGIILSLAHTCL